MFGTKKNMKKIYPTWKKKKHGMTILWYGWATNQSFDWTICFYVVGTISLLVIVYWGMGCLIKLWICTWLHWFVHGLDDWLSLCAKRGVF